MTRRIGRGAENRTLNIPTTNLADTEEIRQWFRTESGSTEVVATTLLNEAAQAPDGLDLVVYDYDAGVEVYRTGATHSQPDVELEADSVHYLAIENSSGATQNANAVLAMEVA